MLKDCGQKWWKEAKFGMFVHWGLYSLLAGEWNGRRTDRIGEWIMHDLNIPVDEYEKTAAVFCPDDFDAKSLVKTACNSGMKYIVITAKHHDGFAMYHSKCSKYNIVDATPYKKDPIEQLAKECQAYDIKLCFYYSQAQDWHHPGGYGYGQTPDPMKNFRAYLDEKCLPQLNELLTQYGDIGLIWFDTPMIMLEEHSMEIVELVKNIQPECLVSGRIGNQFGDYISTGDNRIPSLPYYGDWEVPVTMNDTWGYKKYDNNWKTAKDIIELFVKINSRGGNLLLNIGPDGHGRIPEESKRILDDIGKWLSCNGESIYATKAVQVFPYETKWGFFTQKRGKLFAHILKWQSEIEIHFIANRIRDIYVLGTGMKLKFRQNYIRPLKQHRLFFELPESTNVLGLVVCIEIEEEELMFDSIDML